MKDQLGLDLIPAGLDTPEFRGAWAEWLADRAERRLPRYTARALARQWNRLELMGVDAAVAAIDWSISQGYKGIFPPPVAARPLPTAQPARKPSVWELKQKLEAVEDRIKELQGRSPGEHCSIRDFLSEEEFAELQGLGRLRKNLRTEIAQS